MFALKNQILYTSLNGAVVLPKEESFNAHIVSNAYENGQGVITFDAPLVEILAEAFYGQGFLTGIILPEGLECIGDLAFMGTSLTSITIPPSVVEIGYSAFCNCPELEKFDGKFASADGRCLIVDGALKAIATLGLTEYIIPDGVEVICPDVLSDGLDLEHLILPSSVKRIEGSAFSDASGLDELTLNEGLERLDAFAFEDCANIERIVIPSTVTEVGSPIFYSCFGLEELVLLPIVPPSVSEECDGEGHLWGDDIDVRIIVPQSSVEAYRTAPMWKNYASMIVGDKEA